MTYTRSGSKRLLRDLNLSIVFNLIVERGSISRTELARQSGLPAATITRIVGNFITAGLVSEVSAEESSGGRKPVLLSINSSAGYVVGIKLREDSMTVTVCDLSCSVRYSCEGTFSKGAEPYQVVEAMVEAVKRSVQQTGISLTQVLGVGVGLAGLIDSAKGLCHYSAILGWHDVELGPALEFKLRKPVRIDNDVNTLAVAERYFGVGREAASFLLVTVGRGIGMGIVVRGELYSGYHGGAGEFGHITVEDRADAPFCNCGKRGCLESIASEYGILQAFASVYPDEPEPNIEQLISRARSGEQAIKALFQRAGTTLGIAIANMINVFDPARVIISGEGLRADDLFLETLRATFPKHVFGPHRQDVEVIICPMEESDWARGAASLILREVFQPPIYENGEALVIDDLIAQASNQRHRKE